MSALMYDDKLIPFQYHFGLDELVHSYFFSLQFRT